MIITVPAVNTRGGSVSLTTPMLLPCPFALGPIRRCFNVFKSRLFVPAIPLRCRHFAGKVVQASSASAVETKEERVVDETRLNDYNNVLSCPICYEPLIWDVQPGLSLESLARCSLRCRSCRKSYFGNESHIDLTITGAGKGYGEPMPTSTELFRLPLVSFLYERGWRQSFSIWGGFPGPEKEFEMIKSYLEPVLGGNIIDASCGSGMFSRLFAKSRFFSLVVALDFSEAMLKQCYEFIKQEDNVPEENLVLVRADIARLPFASHSMDAVHAGAALHCWPSPSAAVAEISRVLKPGGIFIATTYILDGPFSFLPLRKPLRQNFAQFSGSHVYLSEKELEELCLSCGLTNFTCTRNRRFVMIAATKPS